MAVVQPPTTMITLGKSANAIGLSVLMNIEPRNRPKELIRATIVNIDNSRTFYQIPITLNLRSFYATTKP
jgi:hypothetical protein